MATHNIGARGARDRAFAGGTAASEIDFERRAPGLKTGAIQRGKAAANTKKNGELMMTRALTACGLAATVTLQ